MANGPTQLSGSRTRELLAELTREIDQKDKSVLEEINHKLDVIIDLLRKVPTGPQPPQGINDDPAGTTDEFLSSAQVGRAWNLSPGTLANWRTYKTGPAFVRIGGVVRYRPEALREWLAKQPNV